MGEGLAMRVAQEERDAIRAPLEGIWGPDEQAKAEALGLAHIVTSLYEVRSGWDVTDFLTGETYRRPFKWKKGERVERWDEQRGWVRATVVERTDGIIVRVRDEDAQPWVEPREVRRDHLRVTSTVRKLEAPLA